MVACADLDLARAGKSVYNEKPLAVSREGVTMLQALVPQLQRVHLEGAGHNIRRERFDSFLKVVRTFLA